MTRVDKLQKKYPSLPRHYIVRWDSKVHGRKDTGSLDELGHWVRTAGAAGTYANYDYDITLKEWVAAKRGRQKPGWVLRPAEFVIPETGLGISNQVNTSSDLVVRSEGNGKFGLYQGDERVGEAIYRPPKAKEERFVDGVPESNFITWLTNCCFFVTPVRFCEYFPLGVACKFCNFNLTQEDARSIGLQRSTTIKAEQTLEAYKAHTAEVRVLEGRLEAGGFAKSEQETKIHLEFVEKLLGATAYKPHLTVHTQPMERKEMRRLKDAGVDAVWFQMEIWDRDLFPQVVPGKAKYTGYDRYLEALQEAVDVFGAGSVCNVFVGGLSMIPENGHQTWQEARDSMIEGNTWLIKHGILPCITNLRLPPGSAYGTEEHRKKAPPTDYYLEVTLAHHQACKEYGFYERLNKMLSCPIDCFVGNYCGELGAYELAGGLAEWAESVIPREANWHRDWAEQVKSTAET